jgi:hypothetical protein
MLVGAPSRFQMLSGRRAAPGIRPSRCCTGGPIEACFGPTPGLRAPPRKVSFHPFRDVLLAVRSIMPAKGGEAYFALANEWRLWRALRSSPGGSGRRAFRPERWFRTRAANAKFRPEAGIPGGSGRGTECANTGHSSRAIAKTEAYVVSRRERKKVEMLFAHLKRILRLDRLRLRGPSGAKDVPIGRHRPKPA